MKSDIIYPSSISLDLDTNALRTQRWNRLKSDGLTYSVWKKQFKTDDEAYLGQNVHYKIEV